jgi:hypothetical protein
MLKLGLVLFDIRTQQCVSEMLKLGLVLFDIRTEKKGSKGVVHEQSESVSEAGMALGQGSRSAGGGGIKRHAHQSVRKRAAKAMKRP